MCGEVCKCTRNPFHCLNIVCSQRCALELKSTIWEQLLQFRNETSYKPYLDYLGTSQIKFSTLDNLHRLLDVFRLGPPEADRAVTLNFEILCDVFFPFVEPVSPILPSSRITGAFLRKSRGKRRESLRAFNAYPPVKIGPRQTPTSPKYHVAGDKLDPLHIIFTSISFRVRLPG